MVVIAVLAVSYLGVVPIAAISSEQDTTEVKMEYDLDEIEVTAQRSPALYSQVARIISVIESKEIEASPAQSIQDLLKYFAGIDVRQRGPENVQADVSIRGGTFDQTLILLNGINITDPQSGHHNLDLPVSLSQVDRIEVLEGPAARIYGPNAFSGAINIVTKQPVSKSVEAELAGGSYGYLNGNVSGSFKTGKINHSVASNASRGDGYIENTDFETVNLFYSNRVSAKRGILSFQSGISQKGFGANSFYTPKYPDQYEMTKTLLSTVRWESNSKIHFTPSLYWRRHFDRFELFRENPAAWYQGHNYHLTNIYGANLNSWFQWRLGRTAFGIEYRSENILSNVLGEEMETPKDVPGEDAEFTKSASRNTTSLFLDHAVYLKNWTFTFGIMGNYISASDMGLNLFPGVDLSYNFSPAFKVFSTFNTSLRMPTFTDLYYSGPTNIGNPDLRPEKSATFEGGFKLYQKIVQGHLVFFYRRGSNIIDWVKTDSESVWQPMNLTELQNVGIEVHVQFVNLQKEFGRLFPDLISLSYLNNNLQKAESEYISNYVLDNLKHKFVLSANQSVSKHFSLELKTIYQDREGTYTEFTENEWGDEVDYEPFWLIDAKITYHMENLRVFISANNLLNTSYNDLGNIKQPGRWMKAGISYKLDFN